MRKSLLILLMLASATALTACGKKGDVKPPAGYENDTQ